MTRARIALAAVLLAAACERETEEVESAPVLGTTPATWATVERASDPVLLESPAVVVAPASRVRIDAPLGGTITEVAVAVGDTVKEGDALVSIAMPELVRAAAVLSGTARQLDTHRERRKRLEELRGKGLVGTADVFELDRSVGALEAEQLSARATFLAAGVSPRRAPELMRTGSIAIEAVRDGVVSSLDALRGTVVDPGEALVTITGRAPSRIEVVDTRPLPEHATLTFHGFDGSVTALRSEPVASAIEPGLGRTITWYEPADGLPRSEGLRGRVVVTTADTSLLQVPTAALRLDGGRAWVVRQTEGGAEVTAIEVLRSGSGHALVSSDTLQPGDRVATDPATVLAATATTDEP